MSAKPAPRHYRWPTRVKHIVLWPFKAIGRWWKRGWGHKIIITITAFVVLVTGTMYGIAQWYIHTNDHKPLKLGASFIPAYAESLGLDAKETMDAMINDLGIRHFRLVSYWNQLEPAQDQYDFSLLDWQFQKAEAVGATVSLSLGLRQPRWPECHMPEWAKNLDGEGGPSVGQWQNQLNQFITEVVNRYKTSPALESYQLENEYFLRGFSPECKDFSRERLIEEYNIVKELDPYHKVIIARSNNALGFPVGEPTPDEFAISIYKRVWDANFSKRYMEYPFPAWFYGFLAGTQKLMTGKDMIIHELQAEAWPPNHQSIQDTSLEEQNKSINAERLDGRFQFGVDTGMREMYLWGAEYWFYRLQKLDDPSLWNVAKENFRRSE